jgi:hypothetical protein
MIPVIPGKPASRARPGIHIEQAFFSIKVSPEATINDPYPTFPQGEGDTG